jgi:hypothetical protein
LPEGVRHFHAYIQIFTSAKFGFATKEQGVVFVNSGKASAVLSEFVTIIGSNTKGRATDGGRRGPALAVVGCRIFAFSSIFAYYSRSEV